MPDLRKVLRLRLSPLDDHDGREHSDKEYVCDHNIDDHASRADNEIESDTSIRDTRSHDHPAKIPMDDTEERPVPFALEDHVMPPADQELNDGGDKHDDANALVAAGLFLAVVVVVSDREADDAAGDGDYRCGKLGHPVQADAV